MRTAKLIGTVVIVGAILLFLGGLPVLNLFRGGAERLLLPVQVGWFRVNQSLGDKLAVLSSISSLGQDNLKLLDENDSLKSRLVKLQTIQQENTDLRNQLGAKPATQYHLIPAPTLGLIPVVGTKQLLLGVGSNSGVKSDQTVIYQDVVLGKIVSVRPDRSTLELLTDPNVKLLVATVGGTKGILVGQFQSSVKLTKVLQSDLLNVGDKLLTTGEENWPKNLIVGEVTRIYKKDNDLFQEADVRPLVNFDKLQTVFVILGDK